MIATTRLADGSEQNNNYLFFGAKYGKIHRFIQNDVNAPALKSLDSPFGNPAMVVFDV